jgi:hypothetical protein
MKSSFSPKGNINEIVFILSSLLAHNEAKVIGDNALEEKGLNGKSLIFR